MAVRKSSNAPAKVDEPLILSVAAVGAVGLIWWSSSLKRQQEKERGHDRDFHRSDRAGDRPQH